MMMHIKIEGLCVHAAQSSTDPNSGFAATTAKVGPLQLYKLLKEFSVAWIMHSNPKSSS